MRLGPNMKRLMLERFTVLVMPPSGDFATAIRTLLTPSLLHSHICEARTWVISAVAAVRATPDCTLTTDEEIAGMVLLKLEERKREQHSILNLTFP